MNLNSTYQTKDFAFVRPEGGELYFNSACYTAISMQALEAQEFFYNNFSVCPGRGADSKSLQLMDLIDETRELIKKKFDLESPDWSVVFTNNATSGLNMAINLVSNYIKNKSKSFKIRFSPLVHNSVYLPALKLYNNDTANISLVELDINISEELNNFERHTEEMVLLPYVDNVFGFDIFNYYFSSISNLKYMGSQRQGQHIILDATQGALKVFNPVFYSKNKTSFNGCAALVFSGHKAHSTPIGVLLIRNKYITNNLLKEKGIYTGGGTISSLNDNSYPIFYNDFKSLEAGLLNAPAILSLGAWLSFLNGKKVDVYYDIHNFYNKICKSFNTSFLQPYLSKVKLPVFSKLQYGENSSQSIVLINSPNFPSEDLYQRLSQKKVIVRSGDFCVSYGFNKYKIPQSVRISMDWSINNDKPFKEVDRLLNILEEINQDYQSIFLDKKY